MGEAEKQILQMVADGVISAEEASRLLSALKPVESDDSWEGVPAGSTEIGEDDGPPGPPPNLNRYRRLWLIPLIIAAGSLIVATAGLILMYQSSNDVALLGFLCVWSIFIIALLATAVIVMAQRSVWLYLNIDQKEGTRIRFALPMPLSIASWMISIARPFVPEKQEANLDMAAAFIAAMKEDPNREPISIDVDDEDGDSVQIYIG